MEVGLTVIPSEFGASSAVGVVPAHIVAREVWHDRSHWHVLIMAGIPILLFEIRTIVPPHPFHPTRISGVAPLYTGSVEFRMMIIMNLMRDLSEDCRAGMGDISYLGTTLEVEDEEADESDHENGSSDGGADDRSKADSAR